MDVNIQIFESFWIPLLFITAAFLILGAPGAAQASCLVLAIIWAHGSPFEQWP